MRPKLALTMAAIVIFVFWFVAAGVSAAQQEGDPAARQLVRRIIDNELRAEDSDHTHWMYVDDRRESGKSEVREVVETDAGEMGVALSRNGRPLTPDQHAQEMQRLKQLAANPSTQQSKRQSEREETALRAHRRFVQQRSSARRKIQTMGPRPPCRRRRARCMYPRPG